MIISDLNYLEKVEVAEVVGGFSPGGGLYGFGTAYGVGIGSVIGLAPFTSAAIGEGTAVAAPFYVEGSSTTGVEMTVLAGLPAGYKAGGFWVGSYTGIRGYAATSC
jgi:hypothetical protein